MLIRREPQRFDARPDALDAAIARCPNLPAVFLIWPQEGAPYVGRTAQLKRRLDRLLGPRQSPSRLLHLRHVARKVEYFPYASRLEANLILYELARRHFPADYGRRLKLPQPAYIRLILSNPFPRTQVTTRLAAGLSVQFGPFRTRAAAERFEAGFLDFFQLRRCQEDLNPSSEHPGCIYGEMNKCLRPCQKVVTVEEYATESQRVAAFLHSRGKSLADSLEAARDRMSELLEFEEAARLHKRLQAVLALAETRGELAADVDQLSGAAVVHSTEAESVDLWFLNKGTWVGGQSLSLRAAEGKPVPLDRRLREMISRLPEPPRSALRERQEHLAILAGWFYSSWRDGEWVPFESWAAPPYRKLVNAVHHVAKTFFGPGRPPAPAPPAGPNHSP